MGIPVSFRGRKLARELVGLSSELPREGLVSNSPQCQALHLVFGFENEVILQGQGSMRWCVEDLEIFARPALGAEERGWGGYQEAYLRACSSEMPARRTRRARCSASLGPHSSFPREHVFSSVSLHVTCSQSTHYMQD